MSIAGYLGKGNSQLRMPTEPVDQLGIEYEGEVLEGKKSAPLRRAEDAVAGPTKAGDGVYKDVDEYDPVLRSHCRI
jgi:hypothetical protein